MSSPAPSIAATVIIPTSIDRGPVLRLAVESVLRQTVSDLEVFIIGDGVHEVTRQTARELERADARVRFFDHPKHARRGEPYRHDALRHARGRIVCYLCDRDLYLPHHVEEMGRLLAEADFAHTYPFRVLEDGSYRHDFAYDLSHPEDRAFLGRPDTDHVQLPLSVSGHTLDAYRRLPEGWTQTPEPFATDRYFWAKFANNPGMRLVSGFRPTVLYFTRGAHPGWSTARRFDELIHWSRRLSSPAELRAMESAIFTTALQDRALRGRLLRYRVVINGRPLEAMPSYRRLRRLTKVPRMILRETRKFFKRIAAAS